MTYTNALQKDETSSTTTLTTKLPDSAVEFKIDQMRGNNPNQWPLNLPEFHKEIAKLPWNAFASDPEVFLDDFLKQVHSSIRALFNKIKNSPEEKPELITNITLAIEVLVGIIMRTNSQTYILQHLQQLNNLPISSTLSPKANNELVRSL